MKKFLILFSFIVLSSCNFSLKEENKLLIPPVFEKEYNDFIKNKSN